jgi:hypothetical protein
MRAIAIGVFGLLLVSGVAAAQTPAERERILRGFQQNVANYAGQTTCLELFPETVSAAAPTLRIFTPPVAMVFRQLIAGALDTVSPTAIGGVGAPLHHARAMQPFPAAELTEFPPVVAKVLPPLPAGLEYRFLDNDLVLRDTGADVIVDVLRNAIGVTTIR